jgi:hypothetical protein
MLLTAAAWPANAKTREVGRHPWRRTETHALLAATRQEDLAQPDRPKKIRGLMAEQMARMEREMDGLQREFKAVSASYGDTVLNLVVAAGYLSSLIGNPRVSGYLESHHPEILTEFRAIVASTSLEESGSGASEEPAFLG